MAAASFDLDEFTIHLCAQLCGKARAATALQKVMNTNNNGQHHQVLYWRSNLFTQPSVYNPRGGQQEESSTDTTDGSSNHQLAYLDILFDIYSTSVSMQWGGLFLFQPDGSGRDLTGGRVRRDDWQAIFARLGYDLEAQENSETPAILLAKALKEMMNKQHHEVVVVNEPSNAEQKIQCSDSVSVRLRVTDDDTWIPLYQSTRPEADLAVLTPSMVERMIRKVHALQNMESSSDHDSYLHREVDLYGTIQRWKQQKKYEMERATTDQVTAAVVPIVAKAVGSPSDVIHGVSDVNKRQPTSSLPSSKAPKLARVRPLLPNPSKKKGFGFASSSKK